MRYTHPALLDHLASAYVLGTLGGGARRRFERLLRDRSDVQLLVAQWEGRLGMLARSVPVQQPPQRVWAAIEARTRPRDVKDAAPQGGWAGVLWRRHGVLQGLAGVVLAARVSSGQSSMGMSYELDAIAAAVIGGSSLMGGVGRITGTLIGAVILGLIKSGFTFVGVDSYIQDIIKGVIIVAAVSIDMRRNRKKH